MAPAVARAEARQLEAILAQYYPGLALTALDASAPSAPVEPAEPARPPVTPPASSQISVRVPAGSPVTAGELGRLAVRVRESLSNVLNASAEGVTVELHGTVDGFRYETGRPWWVSAAVKGTTIDLAPAPVLAQRDGIETDAADGDGGADDCAGAGRSPGLGPRWRRAVLLEADAPGRAIPGRHLPGERRAHDGRVGVGAA